MKCRSSQLVMLRRQFARKLTHLGKSGPSIRGEFSDMVVGDQPEPAALKRAKSGERLMTLVPRSVCRRGFTEESHPVVRSWTVEPSAGRQGLSPPAARAARHRLPSLLRARSRPSSPRPQSGAATSRCGSMCSSADASPLTDFLRALDPTPRDCHHTEDYLRALKPLEKRQVIRPMGIFDADRIDD